MLVKLWMKDFSVSAATSASELRKSASTVRMISPTCAGLSARSQIMPTTPVGPASAVPKRGSIASER